MRGLILTALVISVHSLLVGLDIGSESVKVAYKSEEIQDLFKDENKEWENTVYVSDNQISTTPPGTELKYYYTLLSRSAEDSEPLARLKSLFVYSDYVKDERRSVFALPVKDGKLESIEVLLSYVLDDIKKSLKKITDEELQVVVNVPAFFTQAQRKSVKNLVQSVGFSVLQLVNENSAAAISLVADFNSKTAKNVLIFNSGDTSTQVSVVKLELVNKRISAARTRIIRLAEVLGHTWEHIGLADLNSLLATKLADHYLELEGQNIRNDIEIMKALTKSASKYNASLNNKEGIKFHFKDIGLSDTTKYFTRDEVFEIYSPFKEQIDKLAKEALSQAGLTITDLFSLQVIGEGHANNFIQRCLFDSVARLSEDYEYPFSAAARGAVLVALNITSPAHTKDTWLSDILTYDYTATLSSSNMTKSTKVFSAGSSYLSIKRISLTHGREIKLQLFSSYSPYPIANYTTQGIVPYNEARESATKASGDKTSVNYFTFSISDDGLVGLEEVESRMNITINVKRDRNMKEAVEEYYLKEFNQTINFTGGMVPSGKFNETTSEVWNITDSEKIRFVFEDVGVPRSFGELEGRQIKNRLDMQVNANKLQQRRQGVFKEFEGKVEEMKLLLNDESFLKLLNVTERNSFENILLEASQVSKDMASATEAQISDRLFKIKRSFQVFLDRKAESEAYALEVDYSLKHLHELDTQLRKLILTKTWVSQEVKDATLDKFIEVNEWVQEKIMEQRLLEPWNTPILTTKLLKSKILAAEKLVEDLKSIPRPKKKLVRDPPEKQVIDPKSLEEPIESPQEAEAQLESPSQEVLNDTEIQITEGSETSAESQVKTEL